MLQRPLDTCCACSLAWNQWGLGEHLQSLQRYALLLAGDFAGALARCLLSAAEMARHGNQLGPGWAQAALDGALEVRSCPSLTWTTASWCQSGAAFAGALARGMLSAAEAAQHSNQLGPGWVQAALDAALEVSLLDVLAPSSVLTDHLPSAVCAGAHTCRDGTAWQPAGLRLGAGCPGRCSGGGLEVALTIRCAS